MVSLSAPVIEPTTILRHQSSILPAMAMLAGMQLDLFTPLKDGPLTGKEIAAAIGVNAPKLMPLLYALVVAELLTLDNDRFSNTQEAATYLVAGHPSYLHGRNEFLGDIWQALLKTAATIRAGAPQHKHDFYAMSEEEMGAFFRGQHLGAVTAGEYLAGIHDFSRFGQLLDVGGGSGGTAIGAGDAGAMLRNVARSLKPGGPVFIVGNMLDDSRLLPPVLVGQNLVFINIYDDGLIYTEGEYRALLADAGFVDVVVQQAGMPGGQALISARKPE